MRLTLCLPGLLLPRQALIDTASDLALPALSHLLGRGRLRRDVPFEHYDRLMQRWNLDALPTAALRLLGEGGTPGGDHWLCIDPVHLSVSRRGVKLEDPAALVLSAEEDAALRESFAPFFADVGELSATLPGHWYLRLATSAELLTLPLSQAAGCEVDPALPSGHDGIPWRRRLADAQTLLHDHEVNRRRAAAGKQVVNSLWPWGPGQLGEIFASPFTRIWSTDPVALGLGHASGIEVDAPPSSFEHAQGDTLVIIEDLAAPARNFDAFAWRETLARIDRDWLAPAARALNQGQCKALHIAAFGPDASFDLHVAQRDLLKFWRRPKALAKLGS